MFAHILQRLAGTGRRVVQTLRRRLLVATKPSSAPPLAGTLADLIRSKPELIAENVLLRQQVIILQRSVKRPRRTPTGRSWRCWPAASAHGARP